MRDVHLAIQNLTRRLGAKRAHEELARILATFSPLELAELGRHFLHEEQGDPTLRARAYDVGAARLMAERIADDVYAAIAEVST